MKLLPFSGLLAIALIADPSVRADVILGNGPGATYPSVQAAVDAAQPGDVVLLRLAVNQSVVVGGKGIAIVADTPGPLVWVGYLHVQNVPAGQTFLVSGFQFGQVSTSPLVFSQNAGAIRVQDCGVLPVGVPGASAATVGIVCTANDDVAFLHSSLHGGRGPAPPFTPLPGAAALSADTSTVTIHDSGVGGGEGLAGTFISSGGAYPGTAGGPGIVISGGALVLQSSAVHGGAGGDGYDGSCLNVFPTHGGAGGTGLVLSAGAVARAIGGRTLGGVGGLGGVNTCDQAPDGAHGVDVDSSGGTWSNSIAAPRAFPTPRIRRVGEPLDLSFSGTPGDRAYLALSPAAAHGDSPVLDGVLLVAPPFRRLNFGTLDPQGLLTVPLVTPALPAGATNDLMQMQSVFVDVLGQIHVGCASVVVRLDASY